MGNILGFPQIADNVFQTFIGDFVSDNEKVIDMRREVNPGFPIARQRNQIVNVATVACCVVKERILAVAKKDGL